MLEFLRTLEPQWRMAIIVLVVLALASVVLAVLRRARPERDYRELTARTRSWWIMASVFFAAVGLSNLLSIGFFALMSFWAMKEYITLLETRPADHGALVLAFLCIPVQYVWVAQEWYGMFVIFIPVYMFLGLATRLVLAGETRGFVSSMAQIHWGLMALVFGLSHMSYLLTADANPDLPGVDGRTLVLFLVFVVEMSDVFQYVWGKSFGRRKIIPTVSPNKTWEGLLGGIASTMLVSLAIRFLTPFSVLECLAVVLLVTVAGFFGGAVMSAIKRDFGVKDFGRLIPGHGGMLDRVDSLCFAAPVFFHYLAYFHYD